VNLKRNARGGYIAPQPGGYERDYRLWQRVQFLFTDRRWGYPPAIRWAERQARRQTDERAHTRGMANDYA